MNGVRDVTCVVLAAGSPSRFGKDALCAPLGAHGTTLLERALRACSAFPTVVVCSRALRSRILSNVGTVVLNDRPELGMARSLKLANERIDPSHSIVVLPADLAHVEPRHVAAVVAASDGVDVLYPRRADGTPGHPVVFSPHARKGIAALPDGDTIGTLRDRSDLTRLVPAIESAWPYLDDDRESDLRFMKAARRNVRSAPLRFQLG
jgi:CTP:molybdopterin cytidylyltransferase MocA